MQHHRKGVRAAFATLGGIQSKLASSPALVASCVSLLGCTTTTRYVPLSPAAVRDGTAEVEQREIGHVVDRDGDTHEVSRDTRLTRGSVDLSVGSLIDACRAPSDTSPCLLDDPAVPWSLPSRHRVADGHAITTWTEVGAVTGLLVLGNYECFGRGCSTGGQVAMGVADGLIVLTTIAVVELLHNLSNLGSCGPLAPPCMPREEIG